MKRLFNAIGRGLKRSIIELYHGAKFMSKVAVILVATLVFAYYALLQYHGTKPATEVKHELLREDPRVTFLKIRDEYPSLYIQQSNFIIIDSPKINAYTDFLNVYVTTGFLKFITSTDELAMVIGHELGHIHSVIDLKEYKLIGTTDLEDQAQETRADELGQKYADKAGYKSCIGAEFFLRLANRYGIPKATSHPQRMERAKKLSCSGLEESK